MKPASLLIFLLWIVPGGDMPGSAAETNAFRFECGSHEPAAGFVSLTPDMVYSADRGFGFEPGARLVASNRNVGGFDCGTCASDRPFFFSIRLPEGNYRVKVILGGLADEASDTTIKAELRRLLVEKARTPAGYFVTRAFTVNVRTPKIAGGGTVKLKDREMTAEMAAWDDKLTLEFDGTHPCLSTLEITPVTNAVTVYLLGDSTVCDQPAEPWASWGQMLPRFFQYRVAVANHAESGETLRGALNARRFDKVFSAMQPGDYLFIQFGHNDQKETGANLAFTSFKSNLKHCIAETRQRGGIPVLVTSMERKVGFEHGTLGDYPEAMRQTAQEEKVALIDLNALSKIFYRALGGDIDKAFVDGTHHNNYGSYELARCVVEGIKSTHLDLAKSLAEDALPFDPAHPDSVLTFNLPASPQTFAQKPLGN